MAETGVHMGGSSTTSVHPAAPPIEKADSEYECELMIEALKKELSAVRVRGIMDRIFVAMKYLLVITLCL